MCDGHSDHVVAIDGKVVGIDHCIAPLVAALNVSGLQTVASCCGHGHRPGNIALADGREIVIARDYDEARRIGAMFPVSAYGEVRTGTEDGQ